MFTMQQLSTMGHMQNNMQCDQLGDEWTRTTNHNYGRAISVEAHEAMDHVGFKWWKDKETDWDQLKMELIDIVHFELCNVIQRSGFIEPEGDSIDYLWREWDKIKHVETNKEYLLSKLDKVARLALGGGSVMTLLFPLFKACNLTGDDVFKLYIGKNVLNRFRKDNGYKDGSYIKTWDGREDNEVLTEILSNTDAERPDFIEAITKQLGYAYDKVKELSSPE